MLRCAPVTIAATRFPRTSSGWSAMAAIGVAADGSAKTCSKLHQGLHGE